jgi:hypothetical protein
MHAAHFVTRLSLNRHGQVPGAEQSSVYHAITFQSLENYASKPPHQHPCPPITIIAGEYACPDYPWSLPRLERSHLHRPMPLTRSFRNVY